MEQTTQQTIQKPPLPIKTKIAAWWMIVSGIIWIYMLFARHGPTPFGTSWVLSVFAGISIFTGKLPISSSICFFVFILITLICIIGTLFVAPVFLFKRKKWAWWLSIVGFFLSLIFILFLHYPFGSLKELIVPFHPLILFILLLLDRKNFWKIAS